MKMSQNEIQSYLKEHGIKPSLQRIKIFNLLLNSKEHPTVDMIYNKLKSQIPTLSKTTVYNTLKLFQKNKVAVFVNIENNELRFDVDLSFHGHFQCKKCGKIYDFPLFRGNNKIDELEGFEIEESHYYLKGICNNCK